MDLYLTGRVALVTGSSRGIGAGIAGGLTRDLTPSPHAERQEMSIFDHISLKTTHLKEMQAFYRAALAPLGIDQKFFVDRPEGGVAGYGRDRVELFIGAIAGPEPSPVHLAFHAADRAAVTAFHTAALTAGGTDNGAPGLRPKYHDSYFAAFVIDPAGNNVEAVFQGPE